MPGGKYDIYVYEEDGVFYARPSPAIVVGGPGKKVAIRNLANRTVQVSFPVEVVPDSPVSVKAHRVGHGTLDPSADGIYDYSVDVKLTSSFHAHALGNSAPKIIVDA
jgi:hypothetical protein